MADAWRWARYDPLPCDTKPQCAGFDCWSMRSHVAMVRPDLENLMPRVVLRLAAVFVLIASAAQAQQASRLETIIQRGTLRIGMTGDYLPFTFFDKATSPLTG